MPPRGKSSNSYVIIHQISIQSQPDRTIMIEASPPNHSPAKFLFAHFNPSNPNERTFHTPSFCLRKLVTYLLHINLPSSTSLLLSGLLLIGAPPPESSKVIQAGLVRPRSKSISSILNILPLRPTTVQTSIYSALNSTLGFVAVTGEHGKLRVQMVCSE